MPRARAIAEWASSWSKTEAKNSVAPMQAMTIYTLAPRPGVRAGNTLSANVHNTRRNTTNQERSSRTSNPKNRAIRIPPVITCSD